MCNKCVLIDLVWSK